MASIKPYESKTGKLWRVQYRDPAGKARTKQGFKRKSDAQAWADKNAATMRDGDWVRPEDKQRTVDDFHALWWATMERRTEGTRRVYKPCWEKHVQPVWGDRPVGSIRPSEVQAWVDAQTVGAVMVKRMANILAQVLDVAYKDGAIRANPARGLDLPSKPKPKQVYLTAEQLARLAKEAKHNAPIVWVLGTVGLRWGELAGLRVRNVNVLRSRFTIEETATTNGGEVTIGDTKTHERREVAVPRFVMGMLVPLLDGKRPDDWVWTNSTGTGPMRRPTADCGWFAGAVFRARHPEQPVDPSQPEGAKRRVLDEGFPRVTPHDLRHVAAGLMISSGANVKAVQKQLGHASATMTLDTYAALFDDDLEAVGVRLGEVFSGVVDLSWDAG